MNPPPQPQGTIVFTTIGVGNYGFDVFSVDLPDHLPSFTSTDITDTRLTDGVSVNYNASFADDNNSITFVSERSGSARLYYLAEKHNPVPLPTGTGSTIFHVDRPSLRKNRLVFASAVEAAATTEQPQLFKSYSTVCCVDLDEVEPEEVRRHRQFTPLGTVDYSPAVSQSGDFIAVASYGSRQWKGEFHELDTEIVVFRRTEPDKRLVLCRGGWPSWSGDSTVFFHRIAEDGWWSVFRVDLDPNPNLHLSDMCLSHPTRVTPPGVHAFTPSSAANDGKRIAVATRRKGRKHRHVEIFDLETEQFYPITEVMNPTLHHYNPFLSPDSTRVGYHRFRGESQSSEMVIPVLQPVFSPVAGIRMLRLHATFPSFSPTGDLMVINGDFQQPPGLMVIRSDGSRRWTLLKDPGAFGTSYSPTEKGVVYTSLGPIFHPGGTKVQIARISFNEAALDRTEENNVAVEVKPLTKAGTGNNAFPSCSPDGRWIVFRSGRDGPKKKNLYIVDAVNGESEEDGGCVRRLTEGEWIDTMPHWSPKGDLIAFSSNRHCPANTEVFSVYLVAPDGSGLRRIELAGPEFVDRERVNHVKFSPDGEWLVFTANLGAVNVEPISLPNQFQPYGDLYICRLDGTQLTRLTCDGYENGTPTWHPSGIELDVDVVKDSLKGQFIEPLWLTT